jgi:hypothetical protein
MSITAMVKGAKKNPACTKWEEIGNDVIVY